MVGWAQRRGRDARERAMMDATTICTARACCARKQGIPKHVLPKDNIQVVDVASSKATSICVRAQTLLGMTMTLRAGELQVTGENG